MYIKCAAVFEVLNTDLLYVGNTLGIIIGCVVAAVIVIGVIVAVVMMKKKGESSVSYSFRVLEISLSVSN